MTKPYLKRKFYGRRKGKTLTQKRADLVDGLLPRIALDYDKSNNRDRSAASFFDKDYNEFWLEIGFGDGAHMAEQARRNPHVGHIGCEPFMNGVAALLCEIDEDNIRNIKIWTNDARDVMDGLKDATLDRVFLLHPDPWHKTKHHKRRFIQGATVASLARIIRPGGILRIATDDQGLCEWMLWHMTRCKSFEWTAKSAKDWRDPPDDWPVTRYGEKKLAGIPVYMEFVRC